MKSNKRTCDLISTCFIYFSGGRRHSGFRAMSPGPPTYLHSYPICNMRPTWGTSPYTSPHLYFIGGAGWRAVGRNSLFFAGMRWICSSSRTELLGLSRQSEFSMHEETQNACVMCMHVWGYKGPWGTSSYKGNLQFAIYEGKALIYTSLVGGGIVGVGLWALGLLPLTPIPPCTNKHMSQRSTTKIMRIPFGN